jgi:hypothetical protein
VNKEYKFLQKEIDKLLWETSEKKTGKTFQEMKRNEECKSAMKRMGKLMMELEMLEEENRKKRRQKTNT